MTEKLPIEDWINETDNIIERVENDELNLYNLIRLRPNEEPFSFTDYTWYQIPSEYIHITINFEQTIYIEHYLLIEEGPHSTNYWIAERLS
jgi:hypothetical protein